MLGGTLSCRQGTRWISARHGDSWSIRDWRRDARNKAFMERLKRMWPQPSPRDATSPGTK